MSDRDLLPRRPFAVLPPESGGFEAALARGRQRRRRTAGTSAMASIAAVALGFALSAPNPSGDARLEFAETIQNELTGEVDAPETALTVSDDAPQLADPARPSANDASGAIGDRAALDDSTPAATSPAARPATRRPSTTTPRRTLEPPKEYRTPGGYPACTTYSSSSQVTDPWCLNAMYYPDSGDEGGKDTRVSLQVCRTVDTADGRLSYATTQPVDFEIRQAGRTETIWQWAFRADFPAEPNQDRVTQGDCLRYEVPWPEVDNAGELVDPGDYTLTAISKASELGAKNSATHNFTIPKPAS